MEIAFVDLKSNFEEIKQEYLQRVDEILNSTSFVDGKYNRSFEEKFSKMHDCKHGITLSSGTAGNHLALQCLGLGPGDEVIVPVNTFIATAWGVTLCGAKPVFVDVDPDSFNITARSIEEKISSKTKAIVLVHLFGLPVEIDEILILAKKYEVTIVEDAAQAHLAEYRGKKVGSFGEIASFSFYPSKNLGAFGEAGAIVTNNDRLAQKVDRIKNQGSQSKYIHSEFGTNYRLSHLIAASLDLKLDYLEGWTNDRIKVAALYKKRLENLSFIKLQSSPSHSKHVYHLFVIQVQNRDLLQRYLKEKGIATAIHYPIPLHKQSIFEEQKGSFDVAENLANEILSLPMHPDLKDSEVHYICDCIIAFYS
ncbi:DegT/DnrJ/EryC1/StrS family aminotransferase [bacterium]|nr:DegT/DnrJ/EryC1/StrS family aminotransferase [bacterium]